MERGGYVRGSLHESIFHRMKKFGVEGNLRFFQHYLEKNDQKLNTKKQVFSTERMEQH